MNQIPEWFELTKGDVKPTKTKRRFSKVAFVALPLLIAGVSVGFAQSEKSEFSPAVTPAVTQATNLTANTDAKVQSTDSNSLPKSINVVSANSQSEIQNPAGNPKSNPMGVGVPNPANGEERHEGRERRHHGEHDHDDHDDDDHDDHDDEDDF